MDENQIASKSERAPEQEFNLESVYANNTRFEASVWDIRLLFGQLEQHTGKERIDWHTAVTLPWMQVKLLIYYLRLNLAFHEATNGPLRVHKNVTPAKPEKNPPTPEVIAENPMAQEIHNFACKIYSEMFE